MIVFNSDVLHVLLKNSYTQGSLNTTRFNHILLYNLVTSWHTYDSAHITLFLNEYIRHAFAFLVWSDIKSINKIQSSDEIKVNGILVLGSVYTILGQPSYILSGSDFDAKHQIGRQHLQLFESICIMVNDKHYWLSAQSQTTLRMIYSIVGVSLLYSHVVTRNGTTLNHS